MIIDALYPNVIADNVYIPNDRVRETLTLFNHASDHSKYAAEIVAIERELGINPSSSWDTVADRLDNFEDRIIDLENEGEGDFVARAGDTMTGRLSVPEFWIGNVSGNLEGIRFSERGYIRPMDNFTGDSFKIQNLNGVTLFEVPFDGSGVYTKDGASVLTSLNHIHRNNEENDVRYYLRSDDIGHNIILSGVKERYKEFTTGTEGTETLTLNTEEANHFKIRTNGASVDVNITGIPTSAFRKGITICLQNLGSNPALLRVLNANVWADAVVPDLTTNPGKDTEIFAYSIAEGDRWMLHQYYVNKTVRALAAVYPTQMTHFFKFFGRGNMTPLTITDEKTAVLMNLVNGVALTLEGAQVSATGTKYMVSDKVPGLTMQNDLAVISVVKNISAIEEFAILGSVASSARTTNFIRGDKLSNLRLRARLASQTGSYTNATNDTPVLTVSSDNNLWTMIAAVKTSTGYGIYNMNRFAQGAPPEEYLGFREFPAAQTFDAAGDMRVGIGVLPISTYTTSPTGIGTFICAANMILEGPFTGVDLMQVYRAVRQDMLGLGLSSLPAPSI